MTAPCPVMDTEEDLQGSQDTKGPLSKKQHRVKEEYLEDFMLTGSLRREAASSLIWATGENWLHHPLSPAAVSQRKRCQVMWGEGALLKLPLARGPRQIYDIKTLQIKVCPSQSADSWAQERTSQVLIPFSCAMLKELGHTLNLSQYLPLCIWGRSSTPLMCSTAENKSLPAEPRQTTAGLFWSSN